MTNQPKLALSHGDLIRATIAEARALDEQLFARTDTRRMIELGAAAVAELTGHFGIPERPLWASGTVETHVFMSYHNGGLDGHTSVGSTGAGVLRNVLTIARRINESAGREVLTPLVRARAFYAAANHDIVQLCGRALGNEGRGKGRGDERLSAETARAGYSSEFKGSARQVYKDVMATAFDHGSDTGQISHYIDYEELDRRAGVSTVTRSLLEQELVACADILNITSKRGPLCSIESAVESMCFARTGRILQARLVAAGAMLGDITSMDQMMRLISDDDVLAVRFGDQIAGSAIFLTKVKFSDRVIRSVCGAGIDALFEGRVENISIMAEYADALKAGVTPHEVWQRACAR
jgi:hypothetical protein